MFTKEEREIYSHEWQGQTVWFDPLVVYRGLQANTGGELAELIQKSKTQATEGPELVERLRVQGILIGAARSVFEMPSLSPDGDGVLDSEVWELLYGFLDWWESKKKSTVTKPDSQPHTVELPSSSEGSPTNDTSGFSSTNQLSETVSPTP